MPPAPSDRLASAGVGPCLIRSGCAKHRPRGRILTRCPGQAAWSHLSTWGCASFLSAKRTPVAKPFVPQPLMRVPLRFRVLYGGRFRWARNGQGVGAAQFSVMSPHFQNKLYVQSERQLRAAISPRVPGGEPEVTEMLEAYGVLLRHCSQLMQEDYGVGGGGQSFVHLDGLAASIASL